MISIAEIRAGGEVEFTQVFHDYYARVYHYFLKRTQDAATAQELAQLAFIKLWQSRHGLSELHSFDAQFFRIAATTLIDYLRRESTWRRKVRMVSLGEEAFAGDTAFEATDYFDSLTETLPPVRKKVFILHRIHGRSYKEIAEQLSISIKTVEDHMSKALRHIRSVASHFLLVVLFWFLC